MNISSLLAVVPVQVYVLNDCCERTVLVHIQCCFAILNSQYRVHYLFGENNIFSLYTFIKVNGETSNPNLNYASINHFRPLITDVHNPSHF